MNPSQPHQHCTFLACFNPDLAPCTRDGESAEPKDTVWSFVAFIAIMVVLLAMAILLTLGAFV